MSTTTATSPTSPASVGRRTEAAPLRDPAYRLGAVYAPRRGFRR